MKLSYQSFVFDGLHVIVWGPRPDPSDVTRYASEIRRTHYLQGYKPMGLGIVPEYSASPDGRFILSQAAVIPELLKDLDCGTIVFKGTGIGAMLNRTAFNAMMLVVRVPCPIYVRSSIEDALIGRPPMRVRFDPLEVIEKLKKLGVE